MRLDLAIRKRLPGFDLSVDLACDSNVLALFGPSGSGKSLTLQCLAGTAWPDSGRIAVDGELLYDSSRGIALPAQRRRVGYVPQSYALFPHLKVSENVAFGLRGAGVVETKGRVAELLELLRLTGLEERYPRELSGGQQQRVALARALGSQPRILLLDEPFSALDSSIRGRLHSELLRLLGRLRITTVLVTHNLTEAYTLSETMAVFEAGRVLQIGPRDDILRRPTSRTVARFTATKNLYRGEIVLTSAKELRVRVGELVVSTPPGPYEVGDVIDFCIRPEEVMLVRPDRDVAELVEENQFPARVVEEIAHGTSFTLQMKLVGDPLASGREFDLHVDLPANVYYRLGLDTRKEWIVSLKKQAIHVIGPSKRGPDGHQPSSAIE